jgi:predicted amidohydrolase YtcJ
LVARERPEGGAKKRLGAFKRKSRSKIAYAVAPQVLRMRSSRKGKKGELKVGEYADFIVLSDDLTKIPLSAYTKVRVLRNVVGGRTVYQAAQ